jgi:hypothetical protein
MFPLALRTWDRVEINIGCTSDHGVVIRDVGSNSLILFLLVLEDKRLISRFVRHVQD